MPNLLSNIKILLLLPNILIRLEVSRLTDNITKINSNLIGRFIFLNIDRSQFKIIFHHCEDLTVDGSLARRC